MTDANAEPWLPESWEQLTIPGPTAASTMEHVQLVNSSGYSRGGEAVADSEPLNLDAETALVRLFSKPKRAARKITKTTEETWDDCEWRHNADLIADVMSLYWRPGMVVVDMTWGDGKFWSQWPHAFAEAYEGRFICHDIDSDKGDGVDWAHLPEADTSVDIAAMDPPYVARGGRSTSTIPDMVGAFGMDHADKTPEALWTSICEGIDEAWRILKPGGLFMLKTQNYISSGKIQAMIPWALAYFDQLGFELHDWAILVGGTGPQPLTNRDGSERIQAHLRQNASHLLIVRKPKAKR